MPFPKQLLEHMRTAQHIAVLTGAGISAESGIPTFREAQTGLWAKYEPTELATPQAFLRNPKLVWEWYTWRRSLIAESAPNPGHFALVTFEQKAPTFTLITQNVDSLHQRAGSKNIVELHGNIARTKCFDEGTVVDTWEKHEDVPPRCPNCGGLLRPDVVWFNESLPQQALQTAFNAAETADVFLSIGTSALVQPAASLPLLAKRNRAVVVEVNPAPTPITHLVDYVLEGPAGQILPALSERVWAR